jgi:predicted dehydrogenase
MQSRPGLQAAIVGTGFIGKVHLDALRRLGIPVAGVLGSSPDGAAARAQALGLSHGYATLDDLLADDTVGVVHVTSPNAAHYGQVKRILNAGRHVICEKPLAMTSSESAELVDLARASGRIAAVCYNSRFYPLNQQASAMVAAGELGDVRLVSGHYHQDWLSRDTDWNWRLDAAEGGPLRSVGDIGTHWIDLTGFIVGRKACEVCADLATFMPVRHKPVGAAQTFTATSGETEARAVSTDDAAMILLRYPNGGRGTVSTSQVSHGRKNSLTWEISGSRATLAWNSENPENLWIGHRDRPNQTLHRDPGLMNQAGAAASILPGGHAEGFADTFVAMFRQVYRDAFSGKRHPESTYADFEDAHYEMRFLDAVLISSRERRWVEVK